LKRLYVVAFALLVSGCGGDDPLPTEPPPSPSSTSTTRAAPELPDAAMEDSKEGAVAFVRHYVDLINYAQETGDTAALAAASAEQCDECTRVASAISKLYSAGGHIEGGLWRTGRYVTQQVNPSEDWFVAIKISYPSQVAYTPGKKPRRFAGGSHSFDFQVRLKEHQEVMRWSRVKQSS